MAEWSTRMSVTPPAHDLALPPCPRQSQSCHSPWVGARAPHEPPGEGAGGSPRAKRPERGGGP
eukprot:15054877-Alexandrium_andersonii.AAC.1